MIEIDHRRGSVELAGLFDRYQIPTSIRQLSFGDFRFAGNGPHGLCMVGVERKTLEDMLACITSKRFIGHQLPGMLRTYDFCFLIIEGLYRPDESGLLMRGGGRTGEWHPVTLGSRVMHWSDFERYLTSIDLSCPIRLRWSSNAHRTASTVASLYRYFNDKSWHQHDSVKGFYLHGPSIVPANDPSLLRRVAKELYKIGWEKSEAVERRFKSVRQMVLASKEEWMEIPGIGEIIASRVVHDLAGDPEE